MKNCVLFAFLVATVGASDFIDQELSTFNPPKLDPIDYLNVGPPLPKPQISMDNLLDAISRSNYADVLYQVNNQVNLSLSDSSGYTALHASVYCDSYRIQSLLLSHGALVNATNIHNQTALDLAIERLVRLKKYPSADAFQLKQFIYALIKSHSRLLKVEPILWSASIDGQVQVLDLILSNGKLDINYKNDKGQTAVFAAASANKVEILNHLISKSANLTIVDNFNKNALFYALKDNSYNCSTILIENGVLFDVNSTRLDGLFVFMAETNHSYFSQLLGREWNKQIIDFSLRRASEFGATNSVKLLLKKGADVESKSAMRETSLILASKNGHSQIVKMLLQNEADPTITLMFGDSALSLAVASNYHSTVLALLKSGKIPNRMINSSKARTKDPKMLKMLQKYSQNIY